MTHPSIYSVLSQKFVLLKDRNKDEIDEILAQNDLYKKIHSLDILKLPKFDEFYFESICNFVDYYVLIDEHEFIERIRYRVLRRHYSMSKAIEKISYNMRSKIYDHPCIPYTKCSYKNIKHIFCYDHLRIVYYGLTIPGFSMENYNVDDASRDGGLELVKYLLKHNQYFACSKCTTAAIDLASKNGHIEIVKYLFEIAHKDCTTDAIDLASQNGHFEIVKYLIEIAHKDCTYQSINFASQNGHFEIVKYLIEVAHKDFKFQATKFAYQNGHLNIVKYLFDIKMKMGQYMP